MVKVVLSMFVLIMISCTAYKNVRIESNDTSTKINKNGVTVCSTTPCSIKVGAGDHLLCTPSYWSFNVEAINSNGIKQFKQINPCGIEDNSIIDFVFLSGEKVASVEPISIKAKSYGENL